MTKTLIPLAAQLVKFHTSLHFEEVISRLDKETNKAGNSNTVPHIKTAKDQSELEAFVHMNIGESGFLYFGENMYNRLIEKVEGTTQPKLAVYVIGNPLIAQSILKYNRFAALDVPLRLLIAEEPEKNGTIVAYRLPSSAMAQLERENVTALDNQTKFLDDKLEKLIARVTAD